jgi:hypothetical protein
MNINFNEEKIDFIDIDNIVEYLLDKGLIDDRVIVDGDIEVFDVSRKNGNIKILSKIGHSLFLKVGHYGIEKYHNTYLPWPCGIKGAAETPSLMLGLAGIGHFYLQLYDSLKISNPLMLIPEV